MTTLAIMKARIASEIRRDDLTSQIADAITSAIEVYDSERYWFNESRENTFLTVPNQQAYSISDVPFIGNITKIDYVLLLIGNTTYRLIEQDIKRIEIISTNAQFIGQPCDFAWYEEKIFLYPIPPDVYTVRVGAVLDIAAPATDSEVGNPWMTKVELLIRSRAKYELFLHVLKDTEMAAAMASAVTDAEHIYDVKTNRLTKIAGGRVKAMQF